jgi:VCBS repeat-containing protein
VRKLIIALALTTSLATAAAAGAVLPHAGTRFTGPTSAKKVNGFGDTVTFVAGAKAVRDFSFGTLGCFGYGSYPYQVDPYSTSLADLKASIPMTKTGAFSVKSAASSWAGSDAQTKIVVTVTGQFTSATAVKGTISVLEKGTLGDCGPYKMTFAAKPGQGD